MKIKTIPFMALLMCSNFSLIGQGNTFSECYFTFNQNNKNTDTGETLYDAYVESDGEYHVFGTQKNESLLPIHNKSSIVHHGQLDATGIVTNNLQFAKNQGGQQSFISRVTHAKLNAPICNDFNWVIANERMNNKSDVIAYGLDNTNTTVNTTFALTDQTNAIDYSCNDFIQNSLNDIMWVGSQSDGSSEDVILGIFQQHCTSTMLRRIQITDPFTGQPLKAKANSIIQLNSLVLNQGVFAITGEAGQYAFCILLNPSFVPVNGEVHLFKPEPGSNFHNSGVKIVQPANGNLLILGNARNVSQSPDYDKYFFVELDKTSMNVVWSSTYHNGACTLAKDFEISSYGHYIVAGNDSHDCGGTVSAPSMEPGWAFLTEISVVKKTSNWAFRYHQNKSYPGTPYGSNFNEVELISSGENPNEIFAVGNCWERIPNAVSDDGPESSAQFQTNSDYFVVKTNISGQLSDESSCAEAIEVSVSEVAPKVEVIACTTEDLSPFDLVIEHEQNMLEVEADFCDVVDLCCQPDIFDQLLNQGGSYQVYGCQSIDVNLNAVGTCWQVTWDWGDGTTTGPIPATTDPITHNYSQNLYGYYITWYIQEVDLQGNICSDGFMDFGVSIYVPPCECEECPGFGFTGPELIVNGGFTNGYTGFSSDFGINCAGPSKSYVQNNQSMYNNCNSNWCATGQTGAGPSIQLDNFLTGDAFNTDGNLRNILWEQTISGIDQNSTYTFCGLFRNLLLIDTNPNQEDPVVDIEINGQLKISNFTVPYSACQVISPYACEWEDLNFLWNSGTDTSATIKIYQHQAQIGAFGGDLAVDDLSFRRCSSFGVEGMASNEDNNNEPSDAESVSNTINQITAKDEVKVFPNPTNSFIKIEFENAANRMIYISDVTGKLLAKKDITDQNETVDLSMYENGMYLLVINHMETGKRVTKMIVKVD